MNKMNLRKSCFLLVFATLLSCFVSCAPKEQPQEETIQNEENTDLLYDANGYLKDELPEKNFGGEDFLVYSWEDQKGMDWADKDAGNNIISQALFVRDSNVEERFNVNINITFEKGSWDYRAEFMQKIEAYSLSSETTYHLVDQYTAAAGIGADRGLYMNLYDVPHLDFNKPWWPSTLNEYCTIGENLYFASGDITGTAIKNLHCMFVNLDLYSNYGIADLVNGRTIYQVVKDGDWTLEMQKTMAIGTTGSSNGSGSEMYGLDIANNAATDAFFYSAGFKLIDNDEGQYLLSKDLASITISDWFDDIHSLIHDNEGDVIIDAKAFYQNNSLFFLDGVSSVQNYLRKVNFKFAMIPVFKKDTAQTQYYTTPNLWVSMYSIPAKTPDKEMSGVIMEALASEGYRTVTDAIYYDAFQARYLPTSDDGQMFDIITDSVVFDTGRVFTDQIGMFAAFRNGVIDPSANWTGIYSAANGSWKTKLESIYVKLGM